MRQRSGFTSVIIFVLSRVYLSKVNPSLCNRANLYLSGLLLWHKSEFLFHSWIWSKMSNPQEEDNNPIDQEAQIILKVTSQVFSLCSLSPSFIILPTLLVVNYEFWAFCFMKPSLCKLNCYDYLYQSLDENFDNTFVKNYDYFEVRIINFFFLDWWFSGWR